MRTLAAFTIALALLNFVAPPAAAADVVLACGGRAPFDTGCSASDLPAGWYEFYVTSCRWSEGCVPTIGTFRVTYADDLGYANVWECYFSGVFFEGCYRVQGDGYLYGSTYTISLEVVGYADGYTGTSATPALGDWEFSVVRVG